MSESTDREFEIQREPDFFALKSVHENSDFDNLPTNYMIQTKYDILKD